MESFKNFFFGEHELRGESDIIEIVTRSKSYHKGEPETLRGAKALQLNSSHNQRSWLVRTNYRLYKLLDDRRKPDTIINWSRSLTEIRGASVTVDEEKGTIWYIRFSFRPKRRYILKKTLCTIEKVNNFMK